MATDGAPHDSGASGCGGLNAPAFAAWTAGTIEFGSANLLGSQQPQDNRFSTSGVTVGLDGRLSTDLKAGFAIGFGANNTSIGTYGTSSNANNFSGTAYASYHPYGSIFVDALAGYGAARFISNRFSALPGVFEPGARNGSEIYSALEMTNEQRWDNWRFAPYTRLQFIDAQLDAFVETGDPTWALSYANTSMPEFSGVVGFHVGYDFLTDWGILTSTLRAEYMRAFEFKSDPGVELRRHSGRQLRFHRRRVRPEHILGHAGACRSL